MLRLNHPSLPFFSEVFCSVIRWKGEQYLQDLICRYNIMRKLTKIYVPAYNGTIRIFICAGKRRHFSFSEKAPTKLGRLMKLKKQDIGALIGFTQWCFWAQRTTDRIRKQHSSYQGFQNCLQLLLMLLGSQLAFQMCKEKEASLFSTSNRIFVASSHPAG